MLKVSTLGALCFLLFLFCFDLAVTSPAPAPMWRSTGWIDGSGRLVQDIAEASNQLDVPTTSHKNLAPLPESLGPLWSNHHQTSVLHYPVQSLNDFDRATPPTYQPGAHHESQAHPVQVIDLDSDDELRSTFQLPQHHDTQPNQLQMLLQWSSVPSPAVQVLRHQTSMNLAPMPHLPPLHRNLDASRIQSLFDAARARGVMQQVPPVLHLDKQMRRPSSDILNVGPSPLQQVNDASHRASFAPSVRPYQATEPEKAGQPQLAHIEPSLKDLRYPQIIELPLHAYDFRLIPWPKLCDELLEYWNMKYSLSLDRFRDPTTAVGQHLFMLRTDMDNVFRANSFVYAYNLPSGRALVRFHTRFFGRELDSYERRLTVWTIDQASDGSPVVTARGVFGATYRTVVTLTGREGKAKYLTHKLYRGNEMHAYLKLLQID